MSCENDLTVTLNSKFMDFLCNFLPCVTLSLHSNTHLSFLLFVFQFFHQSNILFSQVKILLYSLISWKLHVPSCDRFFFLKSDQPNPCSFLSSYMCRICAYKFPSKNVLSFYLWPVSSKQELSCSWVKVKSKSLISG